MYKKPILIIAGGTGGHIYPALAVAEYFQKKCVPLLWLGSQSGLESKIVPDKGITLLTIGISGLRRKGLLQWMLSPWMIFIAICQSIMILIRHKPFVVLGMGGFVSGPGGIAAKLMRIPLCVHEQNAVAGLTNILLAPFANVVMEAFPNTFSLSVNAKVTGNPVRQDIIDIAVPKQRFQERADNSLRMLVIGGSLGARALNKIVPEVLSVLKGKVNFHIRHQTGHHHFSETKALYQSHHVSAELHEYIDNMAMVYAWADLVLCRAGAMTIAELSAAGVASILVPYPYAVDDHQTVNARYLSDQDGAILRQEDDLSVHVLAELLLQLSMNRNRLLDMAKISKSLSKPMATIHVADLCMGLAYG